MRCPASLRHDPLSIAAMSHSLICGSGQISFHRFEPCCLRRHSRRSVPRPSHPGTKPTPVTRANTRRIHLAFQKIAVDSVFVTVDVRPDKKSQLPFSRSRSMTCRRTESITRSRAAFSRIDATSVLASGPGSALENTHVGTARGRSIARQGRTLRGTRRRLDLISGTNAASEMPRLPTWVRRRRFGAGHAWRGHVDDHRA